MGARQERSDVFLVGRGATKAMR